MQRSRIHHTCLLFKSIHAKNQAVCHFLHKLGYLIMTLLTLNKKFSMNQSLHQINSWISETKSCKHKSEPCFKNGPNSHSIFVPQQSHVFKQGIVYNSCAFIHHQNTEGSTCGNCNHEQLASGSTPHFQIRGK